MIVFTCFHHSHITLGSPAIICLPANYSPLNYHIFITH